MPNETKTMLTAEIPLEKGGILKCTYPPNLTAKDIIRIAAVFAALAEVVADGD